MAVTFDVPAAESSTTTTDGQSAVDLANPGPSAQIAATTVEANIVSITQTSETTADSSQLQTALSKWELDCNEATLQHKIYIESTRDLMIGLDKEITTSSEELKSLKSQKKGATERLIQLETRGPEFPTKPTAESIARANRANSSQPNQPTTDGSSSAAEAASEPNESTEWRAIPTAKIIDGIERLGQKKRDAIVEAFPTLGDLEDARGEASKEHVHFAEKLPDGIGKTIADKIEERMINEIFAVDFDKDSLNRIDEIPDEDIDDETGEVFVDQQTEDEVEYETADLDDL